MVAKLSESEAVALAVAWGFTPTEPYPGMDTPWRGICNNCGKPVRPWLNARKRSGPCKHCSGCSGLTDAEARKLAHEWGYTPDPAISFPGQNKAWEGTCDTCAAVIRPRLRYRNRGGPCRTCNARKKLDSKESAYRARAVAWGYTPTTPYPGTGKPWEGTCNSCGKVIRPFMSNVNHSKPCNYCGGKAPMTEAEARGIADDGNFIPTTPYPGSGTAPWEGRCRICGNPWSCTMLALRRQTGGCVSCATAKAGLRQRTAADESARQEMINADFIPDEAVVFPAANEPWPGVCANPDCGTRGAPRLTAIRMGGGACRPCGLRRGAAKNRMDPSDAISFMAANGLVPVEPYPGSGSAWKCRCVTCKAVVYPNLDSVRQGRGCRNCGIRRAADAKRFDPDEANTVMEAAGLIPRVPYPGKAVTPWLCECAVCGSEVTPTLAHIRQGHGCRNCNASGYKTSQPGYLYLMSRAGEQQIGITNEPEVRLLTHQRQSWKLVDLVGPIRGQEALEHENEIKRWLKQNDFCIPGKSEDWSTASFEVDTIAELRTKVQRSSANLTP